MNRQLFIRSLSALLASLALRGQDAAPKLSGLLQIWYVQAGSDNLRLDSAAATNGNKYYDLSSNYTEDGFVMRHAELRVSGAVPSVPGLGYEAMADFAINPSSANSANSNQSYNPNVLQDAFLVYRPLPGLEFRAGQFKAQQTYEGLLNAGDLVFAERSQLGRRFGQNRDRGATAAWSFGGAGFGGRALLGFFNGNADLSAGKSNDLNAQKDLVARLEFSAGRTQKFGAYTLQGRTDQKDNGSLLAKTFAGTPAPSADEILAGKDRTTNLGAFYVYDDGTWHVDGEAITGQWGRRFPSLGAQAGAAGREALDQKFLSYYATVAYTVGAHSFALRYDLLNANQGSDWYTAYDPYTQSAPGTERLVNGAPVDYTPKYREITAGYTYALNPKLVRAANLKLNYIARSKNFLAPRPGQSGEQGGDTLLAAFQIAF